MFFLLLLLEEELVVFGALANHSLPALWTALVFAGFAGLVGFLESAAEANAVAAAAHSAFVLH
jgi:hypothetical protein